MGRAPHKFAKDLTCLPKIFRIYMCVPINAPLPKSWGGTLSKVGTLLLDYSTKYFDLAKTVNR